jgi:hypothetical protein
VVSYDYISNLSLSSYEKADLPVYFPGQFRQLPRKFMSHYVLRRHPTPVKLSYPFLLIRFQAGKIAVNSLDAFLPYS